MHHAPRIRRRLALGMLLLALGFLPWLAVSSEPTAWSEDELPWPPGKSTHELHGHKVVLKLPRDVAKRKSLSLVIILHGSGGKAENICEAVHAWPQEGYVVCAPQAKGQRWSSSEMAHVAEIAETLKEKLPIDPKKVHVMGFSNGGLKMAPLAFNDDLRPCSATWVGSGCRGGGAGKWALKGMGVVAMAGELDPYLGEARGTVTLLRKKVRNIEVRVEPGLGHAWPDAQMPYLLWWTGAMEGRFEPGTDKNFQWGKSVPDALKAVEDQQGPGGVFVYIYDSAAEDDAQTKRLQNETFLDLGVRHYGQQLQAVRLKQSRATEWLATKGLKLKALPAVVVMDKTGKVKKVLEGKIKASKLAAALRRVAPDRSKP